MSQPINFAQLLLALETFQNQFLTEAVDTVYAGENRFGIPWGDTSLTLVESQAAMDKLQDLADYCRDNHKRLMLPDQLLLAGKALNVGDYLWIDGINQVVSGFKVHPDYTANGPVVSHPFDVDGHVVSTKLVVLSRFQIDGDFTNNTQFGKTLTLNGDANFATSGVDDGSGSKTLAVVNTDPIDSAFPLTDGHILFQTYDPAVDNVGSIDYESRDDTHLYNATFILKSNSFPVDVPDNTVFRLALAASRSLLAMSAFESLHLRHLHLHDSGSYPCAFQNQLYETSGITTKWDLTMDEVELDHSYNSDGVDGKHVRRAYLRRLYAHDNFDKGLNFRGDFITAEACETSGNGSGSQFQSNYTVNPKVMARKELASPITAAVGQTIPVSNASNWLAIGTSGYGWLRGQEYIHWTISGVVGESGTLTLDKRGLAGTRAVAHPASTGTLSVFVVGVVGGTDTTPPVNEADSEIHLINHYAHDDLGAGVVFGGTGTGQVRGKMSGGTVTRCGRGIVAGTSYMPVSAELDAVDVYDNTGEGVVATNSLLRVGETCRIFGNGVNGVRFYGCVGGVVACVPFNNREYGIRSQNSSDYLRLEGVGVTSNDLGMYSLVGTHNGGSLLGWPTRLYVPGTLFEALDLGDCAGTVTLSSGVPILTCLNIPSPMKVTRVGSHVDTVGTMGTLAKLALALVDQAAMTATILKVTASTTGGWWQATGDIRPAFASSGFYVPDPTSLYAVVQLGVGAGAPKIAAKVPAHTDLSASPARRLRGAQGPAGVTDLAIGDVLAITALANEPYAFVEA